MERPIIESGEKRPSVRPVVTGFALGTLILIAVIGLAERAGQTNFLSSQIRLAKKSYMSIRWERTQWTRLTPERRRALNQVILLTAQEAGLAAGSSVLTGHRELPALTPFMALNHSELRKTLSFGERYALISIGRAQPKNLISVSATLSVATYRLTRRPRPDKLGEFRGSLSGEGERVGSLRCVDLLSKWSCSWEGEAPDLSELHTGLLSDPKSSEVRSAQAVPE